MEEAYICVDGYRIRFVEKGQGPSLLLIHGLGGSLEWWRYNLSSLSQNYRVIAFDFLGFGLSSKPRVEFNIDLATKFMRSFLDAFNLAKVSLVGNSLGGLIAFYTTLEMPERIDRVILVNNAGFGPELSIFLRAGSVYPIGELGLAVRSPLTARMFLSRLFYDPKKLPLDLLDCVLKVFNQPRAKEVCLQVLRYGVNAKGLKEKIWFRVMKEAPFLQHSTLIVWGADDKIIPLNQAYVGKKLIKNSKLVIFEKCGHLPQVEWPEKFNKLVSSFLES